MTTQIKRVGGSFAPPLDQAKLDAYEQLGQKAEPRIRDALLPLVAMCRKFFETPASQLSGEPHPSGRGQIVPLEQAEIERMWDAVPWDWECKAMAELFATIPQGELRNAAHHLLWYAVELTKDREPITTDRL